MGIRAFRSWMSSLDASSLARASSGLLTLDVSPNQFQLNGGHAQTGSDDSNWIFQLYSTFQALLRVPPCTLNKVSRGLDQAFTELRVKNCLTPSHPSVADPIDAGPAPDVRGIVLSGGNS